MVQFGPFTSLLTEICMPLGVKMERSNFGKPARSSMDFGGKTLLETEDRKTGIGVLMIVAAHFGAGRDGGSLVC